MATFFAPVGGTIDIDAAPPYLITYSFRSPGGLTPAGLAAVTTQITTYQTGAKLTAMAQESTRYGGPPTVPASIIRNTSGSYAVLGSDAQAQVTALQATIAGAGNTSP